MHAIVITFDLVDMTPEEYADASAELAPSFAALSGLLTKIWLTDADHGRCGGLYLFADGHGARSFLESALARSIRRNPHFGNLAVQCFAVDETSTAKTQPKIAVTAEPVPAWPEEGW
jgi:hypothetical protein